MEATGTGNRPIREWAEDDRPREKLIRKGRAALSDAELLAILLGHGTPKKSAVDLGREILESVDGDLNRLARSSIAELSKIPGIGPAKAVTISAALELGGRRQASEVREKNRVSSSRDVYNYMNHLIGHLFHEEIWLITLNRANHIIARHKLADGGGAEVPVDNKKIFQYALEDRAHSIILVHNHPSGETKPSESDRSITRRVKEAGTHLHISLLDHVIIGENRYFSFADEGLMQ